MVEFLGTVCACSLLKEKEGGGRREEGGGRRGRRRRSVAILAEVISWVTEQQFVLLHCIAVAEMAHAAGGRTRGELHRLSAARTEHVRALTELLASALAELQHLRVLLADTGRGGWRRARGHAPA